MPLGDTTLPSKPCKMSSSYPVMFAEAWSVFSCHSHQRVSCFTVFSIIKNTAMPSLFATWCSLVYCVSPCYGSVSLPPYLPQYKPVYHSHIRQQGWGYPTTGIAQSTGLEDTVFCEDQLPGV